MPTNGFPGRSAGTLLQPQIEGLEDASHSSGPVVVALSGGVDSAVAARLLQLQGYDVVGVHFILSEGRRGALARKAAVAVCESLGLPLRVIDLTVLFADRVVRPFCDAYLRGRTPSPCVVCNRTVKFPTLLSVAADVGAPLVATGHYARRLTGADGGAELWRGADRGKDQSYFLYRLPGPWLSRTVFPLGRMTKREVIDASADWGLPVAEGESRDICFVEGDDYRSLLAGCPGGLGIGGRIIDASGKILGSHGGIGGFTVGQRRGLGLAGGPWYVLSIDAASGEIVVGQGGERFCAGVTLTDVCWIGGEAPSEELRAEAAVRYRQRPVPCTCREVAGEGVSRWEVRFDLPTSGAAPGQSAVISSGERILGGGIIEAALR